MDVESLINKKKEEIIEEVKKDTKRWSGNTIDGAVGMLEKFVAELKMAIDMNPIGAEDLLEVIEKGGFVFRTVVDVDKIYARTVSIEEFLEDTIPSGRRIISKNKQKVTLIIEPIGE